MVAAPAPAGSTPARTRASRGMTRRLSLRIAKTLRLNLARFEMGRDLALDPLEGVVDGLRVALEALGGRLVGVAVEVEGEDAALEIGEDTGRSREAGDEALELFRGDHLVDRVGDRGPGQDLVEGRVGVAGCGRGLAERDVLVEGRVLVAGRRLHRGD